MTKRELAAFILKLLGVYALIQSLPVLQGFAAMVFFLQSDGTAFDVLATFVISVVPFLLLALAGVALLLFSDRLARIIVGRDGDAAVCSAIHGVEFQAIGFSVVGVLVALLAVPRLVQSLGNAWLLRSQDWPDSMVRRTWLAGVSIAVQLGLALVLFLRARGLANLWHRIQTARYVKAESVEDAAPGDE